jgi:hypothetical protein
MEKTKKCRSCKMEIAFDATKCPHCRTRQPSRLGKIVGIGLSVFIALLIIIGLSSDNDAPESSNTQSDQATAITREAAQKELDELIVISKEAGLVRSYEFSETKAVVYADTAWYGQTVTFKKDFLAKIALLKEQITGFRHFEMRDAYSNEKVAEVTAFSGSLEVYK